MFRRCFESKYFHTHIDRFDHNDMNGNTFANFVSLHRFESKTSDHSSGLRISVKEGREGTYSVTSRIMKISDDSLSKLKIESQLLIKDVQLIMLH